MLRPSALLGEALAGILGASLGGRTKKVMLIAILCRRVKFMIFFHLGNAPSTLLRYSVKTQWVDGLEATGR